MQQSVYEVTSVDDPRLDLPFITIYDQKSLGFSFFLFCLLPILPMLYSCFAQNDGLRIAQNGMLILSILWIITIFSNRNYARKIHQKAQPGQATLVDKFIDHTGDSTTKTLVYSFNYINENGETKIYQTRVAAQTTEDFNVPIGNVIHYNSVAMKNKFNSLINHLPVMWIISSPQEFQQKINRWTLTTSFILINFALLSIWARAAYLATANIWLELSSQQAINPYLTTLLSPEPLQHIQQVLRTIPSLLLIILIALIFIFTSLRPASK